MQPESLETAPAGTTEHLRFAPAILARLGEELVPNADLGVVELVRNAYDADATTCRVTLRRSQVAPRPDAGGGVFRSVTALKDGTVDTQEEGTLAFETGNLGSDDAENLNSQPTTTVEITDDGSGMSISDIRDGWLLLGRSKKVGNPTTPGRRRKIGEKGLGRLAALRLGSSATLTTYESDSDLPGPASFKHEIRLDWTSFDAVKSVEEVPLQLSTERCAPGAQSGTIIKIEGIKREFGEAEIKRLSRALVLLNGAFPAKNTFQATLDDPEFVALTNLVGDGYFDQHEYLVTSQLSQEGVSSAVMTDWRGEVVARAKHEQLSTRSSATADLYDTTAARFELWAYILSGDNFRARDSNRTVAEVKGWLREVGGVHLFQRGLRVHPYGDEGHDWLDLNLRRVRSPEGRPGTNSAVGRVIVDDDENRLVSKTDRNGFVENLAFNELRRFCGDVLDWSADQRVKLRDLDVRLKASRAKRRRVAANRSVREQLDALPEEQREPLEQAIGRLEEAAQQELEIVVNDLQLYRTLGTVGTTSAVFAHETVRPLAIIEQMTTAISTKLNQDLHADVAGWYQRPIDLTLSAASSLRTFAELPLQMLSADKRQVGSIDLAVRVDRILDLFSFYLKEAGVALERDLQSGVLVRGSVAEVEAVVANLVANAVHFLSVAPTCDGGIKRIRISTKSEDGAFVSLAASDNGPGIRGIDPEDVWLPGRTTRDGGTGLGLTIVRDVVADMGGSMRAIANGGIGGAEFVLTLPRALSADRGQLVVGD